MTAEGNTSTLYVEGWESKKLWNWSASRQTLVSGAQRQDQRPWAQPETHRDPSEHCDWQRFSREVVRCPSLDTFKSQNSLPASAIQRSCQYVVLWVLCPGISETVLKLFSTFQWVSPVLEDSNGSQRQGCTKPKSWS